MKNKRNMLFSIIFMIAFLSLALTPDINGKWVAAIPGPNGDLQLTFNFKVNGDSLNGSVTSSMGTLPITDGVVKGNEISFDVSFQGNTIVHHGTVAGDSINLEVEGSMGGGNFNMVLKRAPKSDNQDN